MKTFCILLLLVIAVFSKSTDAFSFQRSKIPSLSLYSKFSKDYDGPSPISNADQYFTKKDRPYLMESKPDSALTLGVNNFRKELSQIFVQIGSFILESEKTKRSQFPNILDLHLSNEDVKKAELDRERAGGKIDAHPISRKLYDLGCFFLDTLFEERPLERFWFLETVARIPYFVYVSMLHLYETLGWWREPSLRKIHNAEEWNELHHLLILECLGADKSWSTRFLGYHAAIVYYWLLIATYLYSPKVAYQFMELLEAHAVDTYDTFCKTNEEKLKKLPAPGVAVKYYKGNDLYLFDDFQAERQPGTRRPPCDNLYDVFSNIRDDEWEHVSTMRACQEFAEGRGAVLSPHERHNSRITIVSDAYTGSKPDIMGKKKAQIDTNNNVVVPNHSVEIQKSATAVVDTQATVLEAEVNEYNKRQEREQWAAEINKKD